jgi:hypothetical protein
MSAMRWRAALAVLALGCIACRGHAQESLQITIRRKSVELAIGDTTTLLAVVTVTSQETPTTVTWTSDNGNIASVDRSGLVRARAVGATIITARVGTAFATSEVHVVRKLGVGRRIAVTAKVASVAHPVQVTAERYLLSQHPGGRNAPQWSLQCRAHHDS